MSNRADVAVPRVGQTGRFPNATANFRTPGAGAAGMMAQITSGDSPAAFKGGTAG